MFQGMTTYQDLLAPLPIHFLAILIYPWVSLQIFLYPTSIVTSKYGPWRHKQSLQWHQSCYRRDNSPSSSLSCHLSLHSIDTVPVNMWQCNVPPPLYLNHLEQIKSLQVVTQQVYPMWCMPHYLLPLLFSLLTFLCSPSLFNDITMSATVF